MQGNRRKCLRLGLTPYQNLLESNQHRKGKNMKQKFEIIENAKKQARMCFLGIAIPTEVKNIDGEMIQVEKVLKFNRKALRNMGKDHRKQSVDPRYIGGEDKMIVKVGKPGSKERVEALAQMYASAGDADYSAFKD